MIKTQQDRGWKVLSGKEQWLLLQTAGVQLPAATLSSSQLPIIPATRDPMLVSDPPGHLHSVYIYMNTDERKGFKR